MSVATPRVLVVSESRITRRVVEMTFADQPLQVAVFGDGAAAADDWQTRPPAVLITDIALQATDGYTLARTLRAAPSGEKACVILLASQADGVDEAAVAAVRASAVLRKPLDSHQLIDAVRQALRTGPPAAVAAPAAVETPAVGAAAAVIDATAEVEMPALVAVAVAGGGGGVAVAEAEPAAAPAAAAHARVADDVALLLGRESSLDGEPGIGAWVQGAGGRPDDGLADTFHALVEVGPPAAAIPSGGLSDADVDRIALRVAAVVATDDAVRARLDRVVAADAPAAVATAADAVVTSLARDLVVAAAERAVREIAPGLVAEIAHAAVREEIARLRAARGA